MDFRIRPIQKADEPVVAVLIRSVMTAYGCEGEGYSIEDPEVDHMHDAYLSPKAAFYVIEDQENQIQGCGGIAQLAGTTGNICELKKMYFYESLRGKGFGKQMVTLLINEAKAIGYDKMYLETLDRMKRANILYQRMGFNKLESNEGDTGHCGCDAFYAIDLK